MDPCTALAVAGNVLQFIQFVGGLLNNARQIHASASGISVSNDHVQDVCGALIDFSARLQPPPEESQQYLGSNQKRSQCAHVLLECAAACRADCEELIRITEKLKVKAGSKTTRRWRSFQAALAEVWKSSEIEDLRRRIADRQRLMILQLCAVSSENLQGISGEIKQLKRQCRILDSSRDKRLDYFLWKLGAIEGNVAALRTQRDVATGNVESLCADISKLSLDTRQYAKEAPILASLNHGDLPLRHEKIPEAHVKTFQWSLQEQTASMTSEMTDAAREQSGWLRKWLRGDGGLFWVSGKPGSGKSTFMKFIADNPITRELLTKWSGFRTLLVISHYFTIYGTPIQRSLEGLLRALLYGILKEEPGLMAKILPHRLEGTWNLAGQPPWTQRELEEALRRVHTEADMQVSICFFIDGLDEYSGDHIEICQMLKQLSLARHIKVCLSSRPWNVFRDALGAAASDAKLYMHELTHKDIRNYTECALREHPRWEALEEEAGPVSSAALIKEVVTKANGVFLWVNLVTRLLREGLTDGDSISDLRRRVSEIPSDLKPFFRHILESVNAFHNEKMAQTLLLALRAEKPLAIEVYMFHDFEYDDEDYAFKEPAQLLSTGLNEVFKRFDTVSRRINGRCKGMLERNGDRIEFFHRTVFDFLNTAEMDEYLRGRAKGNFLPSLSLFRAYIAWIKRSTFTSGSMHTGGDGSGSDADGLKDLVARIGGLVQRLREGLRYASDSDQQGEGPAALTASLLDNMEAVGIPDMMNRGQVEAYDQPVVTEIFRMLVVEARIKNYIFKKLDSDAGYFRGKHSFTLGDLLSVDYVAEREDMELERRRLRLEAEPARRGRSAALSLKRGREKEEPKAESPVQRGRKQRKRAA